MKQTQADKALQLCREHAELVRAIKPIAGQIFQALSECPDDQKYKNPHLREWLDESRQDEDMNEYFQGCKHCWKAYSLIQDRKKLRSKLRIVRMRITQLGKSVTL